MRSYGFIFICLILISHAKESYSIIDDLRDAFMPFCAISSEYEEMAKHTKSPNKDYKLYFESISNNPLVFINNLDTNKAKPFTITQPNNNTIKENTRPAINKGNANNTSIDILSPKCVNKTFSLRKDSAINSIEILKAIAKDCDFSIHYTHNANVAIDNIALVNIDKQNLQTTIDILLKDFFYEIKPGMLVIKDIDMQLFDINYISSKRIGESNTNVLFSQEQQGLYNGFYTGYGNLGLSNQAYRNNIDSISQSGRSGTKIYSIDEINFWQDIEQRLKNMLDITRGDKFIIDKGAGLISIWTTKSNMLEISSFLKNLKDKITLQVSIEVEILSLLHYKAGNIGIDWQQIFGILNPTQTSYTLGGVSAIFNISNTSNDLNSIFNLLRTYGNLRSLSNPKITALNNQPAIISVGSVLRYAQNLVFQSNSTNNTIQNTSTQYPSVFSGILLDITPSISKDTIILRINPSITRTKDLK